jgi:hypothetical protein
MASKRACLEGHIASGGRANASGASGVVIGSSGGEGGGSEGSGSEGGEKKGSKGSN